MERLYMGKAHLLHELLTEPLSGTAPLAFTSRPKVVSCLLESDSLEAARYFMSALLRLSQPCFNTWQPDYRGKGFLSLLCAFYHLLH